MWTSIQMYIGIFGYNADNLLVAPSLDYLQEMLKTYELFVAEDNLKFSTNINPINCETKCEIPQAHQILHSNPHNTLRSVERIQAHGKHSGPQHTLRPAANNQTRNKH